MLESQNIEIFDLKGWEAKNIQIEDFSIQRHGFRMLKALNSSFFESKNLNSKILTCWDMTRGC